jgi:NADH:ubiquinone oxidoreductase subunit B-like Fe-S oxidoreductase
LKVEKHNAADVVKKIYELIPHPKWRQIVMSNILTDKGAL